MIRLDVSRWPVTKAVWSMAPTACRVLPPLACCRLRRGGPAYSNRLAMRTICVQSCVTMSWAWARLLRSDSNS